MSLSGDATFVYVVVQAVRPGLQRWGEPMKKLAIVLGVACSMLFAGQAFAADVYEGSYSKVGSVKSAYGGRYNIYEGSYTKVGYVKRGYGGRWDIYEGSYTKVGYVKGGVGAPAAAAGYVLLLA